MLAKVIDFGQHFYFIKQSKFLEQKMDYCVITPDMRPLSCPNKQHRSIGQIKSKYYLC